MSTPETKEEMKIRMRQEGRNEYEIEYFSIDNQKDYESLLKDQNTPKKVITDIVDRITLVPLKILAIKHQNISIGSIGYLLGKADNKPYQISLIEAFLESTNMIKVNWLQIKSSYNVSQRTEKYTIALLDEQIDISIDKLDILLNTIDAKNNLQSIGFKLIEAIFNHKNFDVSILSGELFTKNKSIIAFNHLSLIIKNNKKSNEIMVKLYEITNNVNMLPQEAKDLFIF